MGVHQGLTIMLHFNICYIKINKTVLITDLLTVSLFITMCANLKYIIKVFLYQKYSIKTCQV